jgi:hypothetical protein
VEDIHRKDHFRNMSELEEKQKKKVHKSRFTTMIKRGYDFINHKLNLEDLNQKSPVEKEFYDSCKKQTAWDMINQTLPDIAPSSIYRDDPGLMNFDESLNLK